MRLLSLLKFLSENDVIFMLLTLLFYHAILCHLRINMFSLLVFILFSAQMIFARVLMSMCYSESDCLEGYSCHEKVCKKCLRCDMLFRKGNSCVTDFINCGECLEGYEEVLITDYSSAIKPCKPIKKVKSKKCFSDSSCPQNNYCNEESCVKCFDCSLVNRMGPKDNCARSLSECGVCLSGFYEVAVTTNSNTKPCQNNVSAIPEMTDSYNMSFSNISAIFFPLILLFGAVLILVFKRVKGNVSNKTTYQPPVCPSAPPLYTMDAQVISKLEETESSATTVVKAEKQQAKVFKQPDALYYYTEEETNDFNDLTLTDNDHTVSRSCSCISAASDQMVEMKCTAEDLVLRYLQLGIRCAFIDSTSQHLSEIDIRKRISLPINSVALDVINADVSADDDTDTSVQTENPSPNKASDNI